MKIRTVRMFYSRKSFPMLSFSDAKYTTTHLKLLLFLTRLIKKCWLQEHRGPSGRYCKAYCILTKIESGINWRDFYLFSNANIFLKFKFILKVKLCFIYTHMASYLNFQHFISLLDSTQLVWVIWWEQRSINKRKCNVHSINRIIDCI